MLGPRHYGPTMHRQIMTKPDPDAWENCDVEQGFIDQNGEFLSREEAYVVAVAAGQTREFSVPGRLYSENLY